MVTDTAAPGVSTPREEFDSREIFRPIVPFYDLLNRVLSLGIDRRWRRRAADLVDNVDGARVLDLATGTGDLALELAGRRRERSVVGADILPEMLSVARRKVLKKRARVALCAAAGERLPFPSAHFDAVTISFGIRNYRDRTAGLREMARVLKPGGRLVILEFSIPTNTLLRTLYIFYFRKILPLIGKLISGNARSYTYLPETVLAWPDPDAFAREIAFGGFTDVRHESLTFGIATIHEGVTR